MFKSLGKSHSWKCIIWINWKKKEKSIISAVIILARWLLNFIFSFWAVYLFFFVMPFSKYIKLSCHCFRSDIGMDATMKYRLQKVDIVIGYGFLEHRLLIPRMSTSSGQELKENRFSKWLKISQRIRSSLFSSFLKGRRKSSSCRLLIIWEILCTGGQWIPFLKVSYEVLSKFFWWPSIRKLYNALLILTQVQQTIRSWTLKKIFRPQTLARGT